MRGTQDPPEITESKQTKTELVHKGFFWPCLAPFRVGRTGVYVLHGNATLLPKSCWYNWLFILIRNAINVKLHG